MTKEYKVVNGTSYHKDTSSEVIKVLENARINNIRLKFDYGNTITGESWGEIYDIIGYIGRSTGSNKIPILLYNSRSISGGCILTHCIISIKTSKGKQPLYKLKL